MAAGSSFSPIDRLLVRLSRIDPGESSLSVVREMISVSTDWDALIRKSIREGVTPFVYRNLRALHGVVPGKVLDELRSIYCRNALRNEF